jgi:hypothetical protein
MSSEDLLVIRAHQLQKRDEDLESIKDRIVEARKRSIWEFLKRNQNRIRDFNCKNGSLVLIRNSAVESNLNRKTKPRFLGPVVVVRRTDRGAYVVAELDGAIAKSHVAVFRVIPYYTRPHASVPVANIIGLSDPEIDDMVLDDLLSAPNDEEVHPSADIDQEDPPEDTDDSRTMIHHTQWSPIKVKS